MGAKNRFFLGLDVGGTGVKAGVVDLSGSLLGFGQKGYSPRVSEDGHAEVPIETIYSAARDSAAEAMAAAGVRVSALAVASQGQTFVSLGERDQALHPAILWYDGRATVEAVEMQQRVAALGGAGRAPVIQPISTAPKIMWLRRHRGEAMKDARRFLLLPDYINYRLTGKAVIDANTAGSTGLYEEDAPGYDPRALEAASIRESAVSAIQQPGTPVGRVTASAAAEWGLPDDTLVVVGTNDQYAGAVGAGNCRPGVLSETTGTCLALVTLVEELSEPLSAGLFSGRFPIARYKFILAYSKTAGLVLDWFRRELAPDLSLRQLDELAAKAPPGSRGLTAVPHFDGRVSPMPDARARGAFVDLTLRHTRADMYRAILESLAFSLRENVEFMKQKGLRFDVIRSIGGGAKSEFWLQMKADVTGLPVEKPRVTEAAVLGVAMLAAVGCGAFSSLQEASEALYGSERVFLPQAGVRSQYEKPYAKYLEAVAALLSRAG